MIQLVLDASGERSIVGREGERERLGRGQQTEPEAENEF